MDHIKQLNLQSPTDMQLLRDFLARFDLWLDEIDYGVIMEDKGKIIGSCCKLKNIYKCFAIDPAYQGEGITNRLLTEASYRTFTEGYLHTFVFTKPINQTIFMAMGFEEVAHLEHIVLLEKGTTTIAQYIAKIKQTHNLSNTEKGAIVMNGNPFTLGHLYLIETAAKQCDQLLVFVVEEDASSFPFKDRLALIQAGTKHLTNVVVLPSSQYMISRATFPNYFLRDKDNAFSTYTRLDVTIFGQWFGKQLNITKRFVGEEPLDPMTNQYNQAMAEVLPPLGIDLHIIPRKENNLGIISASKVRALLKMDNMEDIKKYVPQTTYDYLQTADAIIADIKQHDRSH